MLGASPLWRNARRNPYQMERKLHRVSPAHDGYRIVLMKKSLCSQWPALSTVLHLPSCWYRHVANVAMCPKKAEVKIRNAAVPATTPVQAWSVPVNPRLFVPPHVRRMVRDYGGANYIRTCKPRNAVARVGGTRTVCLLFARAVEACAGDEAVEDDEATGKIPCIIM